MENAGFSFIALLGAAAACLLVIGVAPDSNDRSRSPPNGLACPARADFTFLLTVLSYVEIVGDRNSQTMVHANPLVAPDE